MDGTGISSPGGGFARQFRADGSPASNVIGRIGDAVGGPIVAVGPEMFVMATTSTQRDSLGNSVAGVDALYVNARVAAIAGGRARKKEAGAKAGFFSSA